MAASSAARVYGDQQNLLYYQLASTSTGQINLGEADTKTVSTWAVFLDLNSGTASLTFKARPKGSGAVYALGSEPDTVACQRGSDWSQVNGGTAVTTTDIYFVRSDGMEVIVDVGTVTGSPRLFAIPRRG